MSEQSRREGKYSSSEILRVPFKQHSGWGQKGQEKTK